MTKRISILLAIMLCCLLGLLLLQGYLAYQEFRRQQADFTTQVNELFVAAVAAEKAARIDRLTELFLADLANPELVRIEVRPDKEEARPVFYLFDAVSGAQEMSIAFNQIKLVTDTMTEEVRRRFFERMEKEMREDLSEEAIVYWTDLLGGRVKRNLQEMPVDTVTLYRAFRTRLDSVGINRPFLVTIDTAVTTKTPETTSGHLDEGRTVRTDNVPLFGKSWIGDQTAEAIIENPGFVIFRRSLFTIGGSAAVILLTLLSFYLLFATILRQKKLAEMKDDFIDNVTHELQTPIAALRLAVDSLQDFEVKDQKERFGRYLRVSSRELNRLSELVDGILQQSTTGEGVEKESMDLMELLREVADRHRLSADKSVEIRLPERSSFEVYTSRFHLSTVIENLIRNAIRYSADEGVRIDVRLERKARGFILEIADDGWGIPPEDRRRIFEKFYRSSDKDRNYTVKGLGIGLYHVRQCVEALGGSIRVRGNDPRGTVMIVVVEG